MLKNVWTTIKANLFTLVALFLDIMCLTASFSNDREIFSVIAIVLSVIAVFRKEHTILSKLAFIIPVVVLLIALFTNNMPEMSCH